MSNQPVPASKTKSVFLLIGGFCCNLIISSCLLLGGLRLAFDSPRGENSGAIVVTTGILLLCNLLLVPFMLRMFGNRKFSNGFWFGTLAVILFFIGLIYYSDPSRH